MDTFFKVLMWGLDLFVAGIVLVLVVAAIQEIYACFIPWGMTYTRRGKVKAMSYSGASTSRGTGVGVVGGNAAVVSTTNHKEAEYDVLFALDGGGAWEVDDKDVFAHFEVGDRAELTFRDKTVWGDKRTEMTAWRKL